MAAKLLADKMSIYIPLKRMAQKPVRRRVKPRKRVATGPTRSWPGIVVLAVGVPGLVIGCALINSPPEASLSASPTSGMVPLEVHFSAYGSDDSDGQIVSYQWSFGDGGSGSGVSWDHTYESPGNYSVSLSVRDDGGLSDTATSSISVTDGPRIPNFVLSDVRWVPRAEFVFLFGWCVDLYGKVTNTSSWSAGVELEAWAYDHTGLLVGHVTFWPASTWNIPAGQTQEIDYFIYGLNVEPRYVTRVEVRVKRVKIWETY